MDGYILKLSELVMAYPKAESWPTIYFACDSTRQAILKLQQPLGYVNTPSFPSNFAWSLMTLELNMWVKQIPITFSKSSKNIMKSYNIRRETFLQVLTWNVIIMPITMNAPTASKSKDKLRDYFYDLATCARTSLSFHPTSIARFTMEPSYYWPQRRQPSQVSMLRA